MTLNRQRHHHLNRLDAQHMHLELAKDSLPAGVAAVADSKQDRRLALVITHSIKDSLPSSCSLDSIS